MILDHVIKKFRSGRADSSVFEEKRDADHSKVSISCIEDKNSRAQLKSYVQSRFSIDTLKVFAESSAKEADEAVLECSRLDSELDEIHSEIAAIRTPVDASEIEKETLRNTRNAKRRIRDGIRYSLELALDKANELTFKADEYCALVELVTGETILYRKYVENGNIRTFSEAELLSFADKLSSEGSLEGKRYPEMDKNCKFMNVSKENKNINGVSHLVGSYTAAVPAV